MEAARAAPDEPDGRGNHMDRSGMHRDVHSIGNERETGANETENIRTSQNDLKAPNHCICMRSRRPNLLIDGNESAQTILTCTYCGTCLLRC